MSSLKQFMLSLVATTISIVLTFGTAAVIDHKKKEAEKHGMVSTPAERAGTASMSSNPCVLYAQNPVPFVQNPAPFGRNPVPFGRV